MPHKATKLLVNDLNNLYLIWFSTRLSRLKKKLQIWTYFGMLSTKEFDVNLERRASHGQHDGWRL